MEQIIRTIEIYRASNGREPFVEWLESLKDKTLKARINNRIRRMEINHFGDCKNLGDGVFELRCHFGAGYRVYFGIKNEKIVLLLCGGDKSSQVVDIVKAKNYWRDYSGVVYAAH